MTTLPVQQLYIHGQRVDATSGKTFKTVNPATGEVYKRIDIQYGGEPPAEARLP